MARITHFNPSTRDRYSIHDPIEADILSFERDGRKVLQIDTRGRANRDLPGKVSQSIQLDAAAALELKRIIEKHFG